MAENKRYSFNWERGHPQFWDNYCDLADCYLTCEDVVKLLNELNDKYNEIKEQYADDCNEANSLTVKIAELTEENEQLRLQNSNLMKEVAEYSRKAKELDNENKKLKDLLKSMADRNNEIWLDDGQIIRLNKVFRGEWTND